MSPESGARQEMLPETMMVTVEYKFVTGKSSPTLIYKYIRNKMKKKLTRLPYEVKMESDIGTYTRPIHVGE